jgi:transposase
MWKVFKLPLALSMRKLTFGSSHPLPRVYKNVAAQPNRDVIYTIMPHGKDHCGDHSLFSRQCQADPDLLRGRPIWFGGTDRSEASRALFFTELGIKKCRGIYLAVMDMWKPFRNATIQPVPEAGILFDKFHVIAHLGDALDQVRKSEYARLTGKDRQFIKGQKYTLLSNHANLTLDGRRSLAKLLQANQRLNIAYVLKESFGQLWTCQSEAWARRFFENWKQALKWQRLKPYQKFARMIDRHWEGIAAYCQPQNKVPLGFVEGLNNKIRVLQRRGYGLRDEEYLRLKVLTCMLPEI